VSRGQRTKKGKVTFRSGLEALVASLLDANLLEWAHESVTLDYIVPQEVHKYTPDFTVDKYPSLILEAKGIFSSQDRKKMMLVKHQHPDKEIVMLFGRATNPIRKGSKTTNASWCDKHDIKWIDLRDFKENPNKCLSNIIQKKRLGKSLVRPRKSKARSTKLAS
jgi:hypothetical protein